MIDASINALRAKTNWLVEEESKDGQSERLLPRQLGKPVSALQSGLKDQPAMDEPLDQWVTWALKIADLKELTKQAWFEEGRLKL